jgi:hypothetical protein
VQNGGRYRILRKVQKEKREDGQPEIGDPQERQESDKGCVPEMRHENVQDRRVISLN